jgi:hypothetical protein
MRKRGSKGGEAREETKRRSAKGAFFGSRKCLHLIVCALPTHHLCLHTSMVGSSMKGSV